MRKINLKGLQVLVTAGPTREFFDPVRFLSNPSSGKMGYALAEATIRRGARVTLISGPVSLKPPKGTRYLLVGTAEEMAQACKKEAPRADLIIMTAAVSDYRPVRYSSRKIKKGRTRLTLRLAATPDILQELGWRKKRGQVLVGFAAETDHLLENASRKLHLKNLDAIVANRVGKKQGGFESDKNEAWILFANGRRRRLPLMSKQKMAAKILDLIFRTG